MPCVHTSFTSFTIASRSGLSGATGTGPESSAASSCAAVASNVCSFILSSARWSNSTLAASRYTQVRNRLSPRNWASLVTTRMRISCDASRASSG